MECASCGAGIDSGQRWCLYCRREVGSRAPVAPAAAAPAGAVAATYCPSCGRLFPESGDCPRCVKVATPLQGGFCPRCGERLFSYDAGGVALDECEGCKGVWFDRNEIQRVLDLRVTREPRAEEAAAEPPRETPFAQHGALHCVRCRAKMTRRAIAPGAEVVADFCDHGIWLDGGELERFRAFVEGGGLARSGIPIAAGEPRRRTARRHNLSESGSADGAVDLIVLLLDFLSIGA